MNFRQRESGLWVPSRLRGTHAALQQAMLMVGAQNLFDLILANGPLGYWVLDDPSGTVATDYSGNARHGTYNGGVTLGQPGLLAGRASALFSSGQYVNVPYGTWMNSTSFSLIGLGKPNTLAQCFMARRTSIASQTHFQLRSVSTSAVMSDGSTQREYGGAMRATDAHLGTTVAHGLSWDGVNQRLKLYRNGEVQFDGGLGASIVTSSTLDLRFAQTHNGEVSDGWMQHLAYFGSVLSDATFAAIAQAAGFTVPTPPSFTTVAATAKAQWLLQAAGSYTGALIDVRRSSDNATRTINVNGSGDLDVADLLGWCGSDSVYVSKVYDQSGGGYHLVQTTNAEQPRIVNAGTLETQGGAPVINCLSGQWLQGPTVIANTDPVMIMAAKDLCGLGRGLANWNIICGRADGLCAVVSSFPTMYQTPANFAGSAFSVKGMRSKIGTGIVRDEAGIERDYPNPVGGSGLRNDSTGFVLGVTAGATNWAPGKCGGVLLWDNIDVTHAQQKAVADAWATRFGV